MNHQLIKELDISENKGIHKNFYVELGKFVSRGIIEVINIEGNMIGDKTAELMIDEMLFSNHLKVLNMSKNDLKNTDSNCKLITTVTSIRGLFLHNNKIQGKGGM